MLIDISFFVLLVYFSAKLGHILVMIILKKAEVPITDSKARWIGYLERSLVTLFVAFGYATETVYIFAVKAAFIAYRLPRGEKKETERKKMAEYMLIGSLASYLIALIFGFFGKKLLEHDLSVLVENGVNSMISVMNECVSFIRN